MLNYIPGVYQVPQGHTVIIERFGKFEKALPTGFNFVNPFQYSHKNLSEWHGTASKCNYLMELTEQQLETEARFCQTKDSVTISTSAVIYFKISDPQSAVYKVDVLPKALQDLCLNVLRSKIGSYGFDELFSKRLEISQNVTKELEKRVNSWGITLQDVELGKLEFDTELARALQKKRIAEAEKEATVINVQSAALTRIKEAETELKRREIEMQMKLNNAKAEAEIMAIQAKAKAQADETALQTKNKTMEAERGFLENLSSKFGKEAAERVLLSSKAVEGMKMLSESTNAKLVLLPNDIKGITQLMSPVNLSQ